MELHVHYDRMRPAARPMPHAVLFMDLDNCKSVNDSHGHAVGDTVLAALAARWQACVRDGDSIARYGGDEFVALLANIRSREEIQTISWSIIGSYRNTGDGGRPAVVDTITTTPNYRPHRLY